MLSYISAISVSDKSALQNLTLYIHLRCLSRSITRAIPTFSIGPFVEQHGKTSNTFMRKLIARDKCGCEGKLPKSILYSQRPYVTMLFDR